MKLTSRYWKYFWMLIMMVNNQQESAAQTLCNQNQNMNDRAVLSELNAKFIENFIKQDVAAHNEIIHADFVCIESSGEIVLRGEYMLDWATAFFRSGYIAFEYSDEDIRIFGDMALVRSKTTYTKKIDGIVIKGHSIYTDTYIKENGRWWCVQAHITPVK